MNILPCLLYPPLQLVSHSLTGDFNDIDVVAAPKLMEVVLAHCPGAVDRWVERFVSLCWTRLQRTTRRPLQDQLIVLVAVALHYNVGLTLQALEACGATQQLLGGWADLISARRPSGRKPAHFRQQRLKKLCSLGLAARLAAPEAVTVLGDLKAQQDAAAEELAAGSGSEEEVSKAEYYSPLLGAPPLPLHLAKMTQRYPRLLMV